MSVSLDETRMAREAFLDAYRSLAVRVDDAEAKKDAMKAGTASANDPLVKAYTVWLSLFDDELRAVEEFAQAVESGARLPTEDYRVAREVAMKLTEIVDSGVQRFADHLQPA